MFIFHIDNTNAVYHRLHRSMVRHHSTVLPYMHWSSMTISFFVKRIWSCKSQAIHSYFTGPSLTWVPVWSEPNHKVETGVHCANCKVFPIQINGSNERWFWTPDGVIYVGNWYVNPFLPQINRLILSSRRLDQFLGLVGIRRLLVVNAVTHRTHVFFLQWILALCTSLWHRTPKCALLIPWSRLFRARHPRFSRLSGADIHPFKMTFALAAAACDISITAALCYLLHRSRTGIQS